MDSLAAIRLEFNRYLLDAIGGKVLDSGVFSWDAGLTKWMLGMCMAIAFFQSVLRDERSMLVEWTKIVLASWFAMAILGGVNYKEVYGLSRLDAVPQEYRVKSKTRPTLERAMFNYLAWKFDTLGKAIITDNSGQTGSLSDEIVQLTTLQDRLADAVLDCQPHDQGCLRNKLSGKETEVQDEEDEIPGFPMIFAYAYGKIAAFMAKIYNPAYFVFPILTFILELVRGFVNMFVLVTFGIIAAMSLFFLKILSVFMVIPSYRGRVIGMWKTAMAASMYGFAMNLVIWISLIITQALNEATVNIVIKSLTSASAGGSGTQAAKEITTMMMANFLTAFVIMAMQIVALAKVPSLCNKLMNLSLEEIVNIGETLVSAGLGMAKIAAGMAVGVGGLALGGAGAMAMKGLTGKTTGEMGESAGNMFRGLLGGGADKGGSSGSSGGSSGGSSSGSMAESFGAGPSGRGGGGSGLESTALADANMQATIKGGGKSILKKEGAAEGDAPEATAVEDKGRPATVSEQKAKKEADEKAAVQAKKQARDNQINTAAARLKSYMPSSVGGALLNLAFDGMQGGAGGDPTGTMRNMVSATGSTFEGQKGDLSESINSQAEELVSSPKDNFAPEAKLDNLGRAEAADGIYRDAIVGGKQEMSKSDNESFEANMKAVQTGNASQDQMLQVLQTQNTKALSEEQQSRIAEARKKSKEFDTFANEEAQASENMMKKIQSEIATNGQMSDASLSALSARSSAGMIDYDKIKSAGIADNLGKTANESIANEINPIAEKAQRGEQLSNAELQKANAIFESQQARLVGQKEQLEKFKSVLGSSIETKHLETSREDASYVLEETLKNFDGAVKSGQANSVVTDGLGFNRGTIEEEGVSRLTNKAESVTMNGKTITSEADFKKLDDESKRILNEMFDIVNLGASDKETNNMLAGKLTDKQIKNLGTLQELGKKIRGK